MVEQGGGRGAEDEPALIINVLNSSVMPQKYRKLRKKKNLYSRSLYFFPSSTSITELIPQCFQSSMLHLTVNDTTLVFHSLKKIIGMVLGYQGSSCHHINVSLRAVQRIVESAQCIGTMAHAIICSPGPLLLAIHCALP